MSSSQTSRTSQAPMGVTQSHFTDLMIVFKDHDKCCSWQGLLSPLQRMGVSVSSSNGCCLSCRGRVSLLLLEMIIFSLSSLNNPSFSYIWNEEKKRVSCLQNEKRNNCKICTIFSAQNKHPPKHKTRRDSKDCNQINKGNSYQKMWANQKLWNSFQMDVLLVPYALTLKPLIFLRALGPKVEHITCFHEFWNY